MKFRLNAKDTNIFFCLLEYYLLYSTFKVAYYNNITNKILCYFSFILMSNFYNLLLLIL